MALYSPPTANTDQIHHCLAINPLNIACLLYSDRFNKIIQNYRGVKKSVGHEIKDRYSEDIFKETPLQDQTPIKRLASFLFHEAIHEVTHFFYPDYASDEHFHSNVSKIEQLCHHLWPEIIQEVKKYIDGVRKDSNQILNVLKEDIKTLKSS